MEYTFSESFGSGPKMNHYIEFQIDLTEKEEVYLRDYIEKNGPDCGYDEIEFDNQELFDKINDIANQAVLDRINEDRREFEEDELDFYDVNWGNMSFDFNWPKELYDEH